MVQLVLQVVIIPVDPHLNLIVVVYAVVMVRMTVVNVVVVLLVVRLVIRQLTRAQDGMHLTVNGDGWRGLARISKIMVIKLARVTVKGVVHGILVILRLHKRSVMELITTVVVVQRIALQRPVVHLQMKLFGGMHCTVIWFVVMMAIPAAT